MVDGKPPELPPRRGGIPAGVDNPKPTGPKPATNNGSLEHITIPEAGTDDNAGADENAGKDVDSGYGSTTGTPGEKKRTQSFQGEEVVLGDSGLFGRRPKNMRRFRTTISQAHLSRYSDLEETFCRSLGELLAKKKKKHVKPLDIGLVVLGQTDATARPCILVTCNKSILRYVTSFFDQKWVEDELKPDLADGFPSFDLYIKSLPCKPKAASPVEVYERKGDKVHLEVITNGHPIFAQTPDGWKRSTIGGFIEVVRNPSQVELYGLTAGHLIVPWEESDSEDDSISDDQSDSTEETCAEEEWDIELEGVKSHDEVPDSAVTDQSQAFETPDVASLASLGHGFELKSAAMGCKSLDYALLSVRDKSRCFNSRALHKPPDQHIKIMDHSQPRSVKLLNAYGVELQGILSMTISSLLLSQSAGFVKTFKLELFNGNEVNEGDSGAWVVDILSDVVWGHVVAVDLFGDAHVIPMDRVLEDMRLGFDAQEVKLAEHRPPIELDASTGNVRGFQDSGFVSYTYSENIPPDLGSADSGYNTREASKDHFPEMQSKRLPSATNPGKTSDYQMQLMLLEQQNMKRLRMMQAEAKPPPEDPSNNLPAEIPLPPISERNANEQSQNKDRNDDSGYYTSPSSQVNSGEAPLPITSAAGVPLYGPYEIQQAKPGYDSGYVSQEPSPHNNQTIAGDKLRQNQAMSLPVGVSASFPGPTVPGTQMAYPPMMASQYSILETLKELDALKETCKRQEQRIQNLEETLDATRDDLGPKSYHESEHRLVDSRTPALKYSHAQDRLLKLKEQIVQTEAELAAASAEMRREQNRIRFIGPWENKYALPLSSVKTWKDMQAFLAVIAAPTAEDAKQIQDQQFDLVNAEGELLLRQFWEETIEPGATVTMRLWPQKPKTDL